MGNSLTLGWRTALASVSLIGLGGCSGGGTNPNGPKMTNAPGAVTAVSTKLSGHFEIRPAQPGEPGIFSSSDMGGACLVAQYPAQPKSCTKHTECALPTSGIGDGAASYCLPDSPGAPKAGNEGAVPPGGAGSCWIKPSEDFCLKRVGVGAHDTPPADSAPVAAATRVKRWRVLTCLNGIPGACAGTPATPNEYMHLSGPVYTAP